MRPGMLVGVAAWLLGAVAATLGSLYAVNKIGADLLQQQARQVSIATINAEYALQGSGRAAPPARPAAHRPGSAGSAGSGPPRHLWRSGQAGQASPGRATALLASPDGTAGATCGRGGAYLVYVSPQQGFQADDVQRGPAAVASVTFESWSGGVVMTVTCQGGSPVEHLTPVSQGAPPHDE